MALPPVTRPQSWDLIYCDLEELNDLYHKQVDTTIEINIKQQFFLAAYS